jgi:hypothetical protein
MFPPRSIPAASPRLPELANRGIAGVLLVLGLAGMFTEAVSTAFAPRLVLFLIVLAFGVIGFVRCRRIDQQAISCGSPSPGSR